MKYNKLDKDKLIDYALLHLFEILKLEDKIILLNSLYNENPIPQEFKDRMKRILQIFLLLKMAIIKHLLWLISQNLLINVDIFS